MFIDSAHRLRSRVAGLSDRLMEAVSSPHADAMFVTRLPTA